MQQEQTISSTIRPTAGGSKALRDRVVLLGLLALLIIGLLGAAAATGWSETLHQIQKLTLWQVCALLALSLMNYGLRGLRWHLFAKRLGLDLSLTTNMRHFLGGFAMTVTPGRVGELVRMRWIRRETGWAFERTAPLVLVDRASDLAAMAVLLAGALLLSTSKIAGGVPVTLLALLAAFIVTRPALLAWCASLGYRTTGKAPRLFAKLRRAASALAPFSQGGTLFQGSVLAFAGWLAEGLAFYLLLAWMGADVTASTAIAIFLFSTLAGGLTGAPGGVGGAEAAMIALLSLEGVPLALSLPATAIIRLTTLWFAIVIGLIIFPIAERISKRIQT
ncbi:MULTISPECIES: lysylphosphatidylglycerol synthase transmembrane domain-containing protein [Pacificibacter]|uniref:lysylphosphatidylglycerol synthase transmembrane domain-containing protein n=1 Tax=Pacificibacter TaxID=1042323 RepID=UPI001C08BC83|nr:MULTISPECIES: lysylphosphatidylglycerol synthase transmembrane domain-containing protein [Pacificibacter]MBU2937094.1 flippase-like domain-containing protein [Pacificibacter marinus]MDO6616366.1 lysylphosphatidylglycerol synthase transmembrane domain-containing protein [Pacificibacter sp. 1_MG-2023]